jgi:hypothetical protein
MVRAVICTVAVLAGFAVVENSSNASTDIGNPGFAGTCKVSQAFAMLHPGEQLPVRLEGSPEATVVGALATQIMTGEVVPSVVTLTGSQNGWARIALNSRDYTSIDGATHQYGWVPADSLAVDTRLGGTVTLYNHPGLIGSTVDKINNDDQHFRVLGCNGSKLQVINARYGNVWIDRWCAKPEGCRG